VTSAAANICASHAVETRARRPDPNRHGNVGCGNVLEQFRHALARNDRTAGVHLQDQRLRAGLGRSIERLFDCINLDLVEETADFLHVDGQQGCRGRFSGIVSASFRGAYRIDEPEECASAQCD